MSGTDKWSRPREARHPWRIRKFRECLTFRFLIWCENNPSLERDSLLLDVLWSEREEGRFAEDGSIISK